jgi:hypothetical protein
MDAAMLTAISALIAAPFAAAAAVYGSRGANKAAREGGVITGYDSLTDQLQEERADLRTQLANIRTELTVEKTETARLRLLVTQLGGTP